MTMINCAPVGGWMQCISSCPTSSREMAQGALVPSHALRSLGFWVGFSGNHYKFVRLLADRRGTATTPHPPPPPPPTPPTPPPPPRYVIPEWLAKKRSGNFFLVRCEDWGPATHMHEVLKLERHPNTFILQALGCRRRNLGVVCSCLFGMWASKGRRAQYAYMHV